MKFDSERLIVAPPSGRSKINGLFTPIDGSIVAADSPTHTLSPLSDLSFLSSVGHSPSPNPNVGSDLDTPAHAVTKPSWSVKRARPVAHSHSMPRTVEEVVAYCPVALKYFDNIKPAFIGPAPKRSHSARPDPSHIPRPPNAFIIYRSWFCATAIYEETRYNILVKEIAELWTHLPEDERQPFTSTAAIVRERHSVLYPGYKYRPSNKTAAPSHVPTVYGSQAK